MDANTLHALVIPAVVALLLLLRFHYNHTSTASGYPLQVFGSKTLTIPYKVNYGDNTSTQPENQTILLMAYQVGAGGYPVASRGGSQAVLSYRARYRYKDP